MLAGPLFHRETLTLPRPLKHYLLRAMYLGALFILLYTSAQTTFGWQHVRNVGDIARFGSSVFQVLCLVQLTLVLFFSMIFASGNVAQEKDRRTLILLLMTDLRDGELVFGKLLAALLLPAVLVAISYPALAIIHLLGGVSFQQVTWAVLISAAAGFAAGSWGVLVAFWREKTFQTLAICLIGLILFLGVVEGVSWLVGGTPVGVALGLLNPYRALFAVIDPFNSPAGLTSTTAAAVSLGELLALAAVLNVATLLRLRVWNPNQSVYEAAASDEDPTGVERRARQIWDAPVIWREICTRAYGRKMVLIKLAYFVLAGLIIGGSLAGGDPSRLILGMITQGGFAFVALGLLSLLLVNAQAVTSLTTERDAATLDLLLVTEISAKEFLYGKLGGVLFNTWQLIAAPLVWLGFLVAQGHCTIENSVYVTIGFLTLTLFSAMLGLHFGLAYGNSRQAISNSLGTIFFLFVGVFVLLVLLLQARASFALQLPSFLVFILGGSLGLWSALTHRNPSPALSLAAAILPFCTFYAVTSFLLGQTLGVCLFITAAYGFTVIAMLVPAVSEFDVALGRSTQDLG